MVYKTFNNKTYNIYTIKTDKFKTCHMEIIFRNNIRKDDITKRTFITELLVENSKLYKTRKDMIIELENLYNSYFYGVTNRVGSSILTSFCFDFIDPNLIDEEIDEFIKFPLNNILNPNVTNNEFDITTFEYIKTRIKTDIESIIEDPKTYAIDKLLNNMCKDTESSINISGYIEDLDVITPTNLYDYYNEILNHDYIDIYIIGNLDMNKVVSIIKNNFKINIFKDHEITYNVQNKSIKKPKKIIENYNSSQENICIGLNIENMTDREKNYVGHIYNSILGGNSLESKLYTKLRNENSLCYTCSSIYQKFDKLLILYTAVSNEKENDAIKLMKESILEIRNGNITDDELENAKKLITTTLTMSEDNPGRVVDNYLYKNLYGLDDLEIRIKNYNSITKKEVIDFSKKIKLNTILCLRDDENEENKNK